MLGCIPTIGGDHNDDHSLIERVDGYYDEYDHQGHDTLMTRVKECLTLFICSLIVYPSAQCQTAAY